jgi:hypothetical protein
MMFGIGGEVGDATEMCRDRGSMVAGSRVLELTYTAA